MPAAHPCAATIAHEHAGCGTQSFWTLRDVHRVRFSSPPEDGRCEGRAVSPAAPAAATRTQPARWPPSQTSPLRQQPAVDVHQWAVAADFLCGQPLAANGHDTPPPRNTRGKSRLTHEKTEKRQSLRDPGGRGRRRIGKLQKQGRK